MIEIKFCPKCSGHPYTLSLTMTHCPICNTPLRREYVGDDGLSGRRRLPNEPGGRISPFGQNDGSSPFSDPDTDSDTHDPFQGSSSSPFGSDRDRPFGSGGDSPFGSGGDSPFGSGGDSPFGSGETGGTPGPLGNPQNGNGNKPQIPGSGKKGLKERGGAHITTPVTPTTVGSGSASSKGEVRIRGKVTHYSNSEHEGGHYKRLLFQRIIDALVYGQRIEDLVHRFVVRVSTGTDAYGNETYTDIPVNVHGTISSGAQLCDNIDVEVIGKYRKSNGTLMAKKIHMLNSGGRSMVSFQHSPKAILYGVLAIIALILLVIVGFSSNGGFFQNIGSFFKTWLGTAVVLTVLYFISMFSRSKILYMLLSGRRRGFPLTGILLISLIITVLLLFAGTSLSGLISSIISSVVILIVLIVILKLILGF